MPTYVSKAWTEHGVEYTHEFRWADSPSAGFSFECDKDGKVDVASMAEAGRANYTKCIDGTYDVVDEGVSERQWTYRHRAVIKCSACKNGEVCLANFTNTCECGADYNMSGSRLADRSQWGEETGEHWTECY